MLPHPLSNFEIQKYYQNESKFNGVYSINNSSKIKDGTYLTNLESIGTYWIALYVNAKNVTYFNSFGVNIFQKKLKNSIEIKTLKKIFIEYKHIIQKYVNIYVLDLLVWR